MTKTKKKGNPVTTMLVISMGLVVIYMKTQLQWLLNIALIIGLIGIFSTYLSSLIDIAWMKLAKLLSFIVPNILLSLVFFAFLYPLSLISKIFSKKDSLMLSPGRTTTFETVNKTFNKEIFEKSW